MPPGSPRPGEVPGAPGAAPGAPATVPGVPGPEGGPPVVEPIAAPGAVPAPTATATPSGTVRVKADVIEYDRQKKIATARGNVDVTYKGARITSEFLQLDQARDTVQTGLPFVLTQPDPKGTQTVKGTGLAYNLKTEDATVSNALLEVPAPETGRPVFVQGRELYSQGRKKFSIKDGIFSTCEEIEHGMTPHYHVTSKSLEFVQDDYALGWDSWIYVNNRRLFWVPFFWVPLKKRETSVQVGQNDVEGVFVKTSWGYRLGPSHWGTLYTHYMQKKGPGLGVTHNWQAPNSLSLFETYGLAQSDQNPGDTTGLTPEEEKALLSSPIYAGGVDPLYRHGLDRNARRPFDDYQWRVRHQQRLFDTMTVDVNAEDYNIYTVQNAQTSFGGQLKARDELAVRAADIREDHTANGITITDSRAGVNYSLNRQFRHDRANRGTLNQTSTSYGGNASWTGFEGGTSIQISADHRSTLPLPIPTPPPASPSATPTPAPGATPTPNPESITTTGNLTVNQKLPPLPGTTSQTNARWVSGYSKQVNPGQPVRETLQETLEFTSDLGWGDGRLTLDRKFVFQPDPASPSTIAQSGALDKLPELEIKGKPLFQEYQPVTLAADMGRYFDSAVYPSTDAELERFRNSSVLKARLGPISRFRPYLSLVSKAHELGFNSTVDFGGSGFEQRFYSTGDQAYSTTLNSNLGTQYTEWLKQTITYRRVMPGGADEPPGSSKRSNTPFRFDALSLARSTTLDVAETFEWKGSHTRPLGELLALTGLPSRDWTDFPGTITWTHRMGYDYERLRYSDYNTNLTFNPEPRISATLGSSYHFKEVPYLDLRDGKWNQTTFNLTLRSTGEVFGGNWGLDKIVPGAALTSALVWDPDKGKITSLTNDLVASFGDTWSNHWELYVGGAYEQDPSQPRDPDKKIYRLRRFGIARDLHDFIVSLDYDRVSEQVTLKLKMTALNFDLLNLNSQSIGAGNIVGGLGGLTGTGP